MKKMTVFSVLLLALGSAQAQEWNDLNVLQVNRENPRATMMVYPTAAAAVKYDRTASPWFQSLNGEWKFHWVKSPANRRRGHRRGQSDNLIIDRAGEQ